MDPEAADAQNVLANVYLYRHEYDWAIDLLRRLIAATADDVDLQESLADTYVYAGDGAKGLPILDRLLRIDPFHDQGVYPIYGRG